MKKKLLLSAILAILILLAPSAKAQTAHFVTISWSYTQGTDLAVGFNVYRFSASNTTAVKLNTSAIPLATLTFNDTTGTGGTLYSYFATAVDLAGIESSDSPIATATFISSSPNAPAGTTATAH